MRSMKCLSPMKIITALAEIILHIQKFAIEIYCYITLDRG